MAIYNFIELSCETYVKYAQRVMYKRHGLNTADESLVASQPLLLVQLRHDVGRPNRIRMI